MFNVSELEGKTLVKVSTGKVDARYVTIEDGKVIYIKNTRTQSINKITFTYDEEGSRYQANLEYSNSEKTKQKYVSTSGSMAVLAFGSVLSMYIKKGILYLIAADENEIYE